MASDKSNYVQIPRSIIEDTSLNLDGLALLILQIANPNGFERHLFLIGETIGRYTEIIEALKISGYVRPDKDGNFGMFPVPIKPIQTDNEEKYL